MPRRFSTAEFAAAVADCSDAPSVTAMMGRFADVCGARWAVVYSFEAGIRTAAEAWTPLFSSFPQEVSEYYADNRCIAADCFARAAMESTQPVRFLEIEDSLEPDETIQGLYALMRANGLVDGLALHVCDRPGRLIYFCLAFDRSLDSLSELERRRIRACAEMLVRHGTDLLETEPSRELSPQERSVVALLARGDSNKAIARILGVSPSTINTVVQRCFEKLGARTRAEAAIAASRAGLALVA